MSLELDIPERHVRMNAVVEEILKGNTASEVAKITGFKRAEVLEYIEEWKDVVHKDTNMRDRAREAIAGMDSHYNKLKLEAWSVIEEAGTTGQLGAKTGAIKLIADIEEKRIKMLQSIGVLENTQLANQVVEAERKQDILVKILKEVTSTCPNCKKEVSDRLLGVTGVVESVVIQG